LIASLASKIGYKAVKVPGNLARRHTVIDDVTHSLLKRMQFLANEQNLQHISPDRFKFDHRCLGLEGVGLNQQHTLQTLNHRPQQIVQSTNS